MILIVDVYFVGTRIQLEIEMTGRKVYDTLAKNQLIATRHGAEAKTYYIESAKALRVMEEMSIEAHFIRTRKHAQLAAKIRKPSFEQRWRAIKHVDGKIIQRVDDKE